MEPLREPNDEEKAEAIRIMADCYPPRTPFEKELYAEAERVLFDHGT
jgi:hypothetical protein